MQIKYWLSLGLIFALSPYAFGSEEMMNQMPKIKPKASYTVESKEKGEDLLDSRGFGDKEPMVRMMNLMMVEGSGVEGMDMNGTAMSGSGHEMHHAHQMKMAANEEKQEPSSMKMTSQLEYEVSTSPPKPKVGANSVTITIRDSKTRKPSRGLKLKAQVYMMTMDMGTSEPRVREIAPGKYRLKATFAMKGPWAVKLITPSEEKVFNFDVQSK